MVILSSLTQLQCVTCIFNRKVFALWLFSDVNIYGYECVGLAFRPVTDHTLDDNIHYA